MTTTDRPAAPLIPATEGLLEGWRGPLVWHQYVDGELVDLHELVVGEVDGVPWVHWPDGGQPLAGALGERGVQLLLDLRRPEVARHVREHLAARHGLDEVEHGVQFVPWDDGVYLLRAGSDLPFAADADWYGESAGVHIPALASLPEEHRDAWALWECWRAMEVDRD